MLSWQWPYLFALLPLPLVIRWLLPARESAMGAVHVPFYESLENLSDYAAGAGRSAWLIAILVLLTWACLVTAAARPTWIGEPVNLPQERRDLMLAVDLSGSMKENDMQVNGRYIQRIDAVKAVVGDFVKKRSGDRLGLILFGEQSYLQTPLTYDSQTVNTQLQEAQLGWAGRSTAIGDSIGLAIKKLRSRPADSRVLILLTDGANTAGKNPLEAADIAAEVGIRIHTVGVGADSKITKDFFGREQRVNPSADLDEKTLNLIAKKTGGQYFRARNPRELQAIYQELDKLEPIPDEQTFRPTRSLTHWPMALGLFLSVVLLINMGRLSQ